jgi:hypothetical protein
MQLTKLVIGSAILATGLAAGLAYAGGDKIAFPEGFEKGVLYTSVDRADNKQYRELFTQQSAIDAIKAGKPTPSGTVITLVQYRAQLDAQGNPQKGADGRSVKGDLLGYTVMEKRAGWGEEYPDTIRNGEWEYQAFTATRQVNDKANLKACFECHKPLAERDFLFTHAQLKAK